MSQPVLDETVFRAPADDDTLLRIRPADEAAETSESAEAAAEQAETDELGLERGDDGLVGSFVWTLREGDRWVLAPESAFLFTDCWRKTLVREAYMHLRPSDDGQMLRETVATLARRFITGEPFLLDLYVAERDGAELGISSDELGGSLYATRVDRGPLVCRKAVYFGSQPELTLRPVSPLQGLRRGMPRDELIDILKRTAYGPGWIFQRFEARAPENDTLILQIDGDVYFRELKKGETLRADPRHCYAWDETVSHRLVRFGHITDRLLRGSVPFQIEFEGPGRLWLSNMSFADGYLGSIFTPSHWVFNVQQLFMRVLRALNPLTWF